MKSVSRISLAGVWIPQVPGVRDEIADDLEWTLFARFVIPRFGGTAMPHDLTGELFAAARAEWKESGGVL